MARPHSSGHRYTVRRLTTLAAVIDSPDRHVQVRLPIVCGLNQMPGLDFAFVRGPNTDYVDHLPTAADVLCVIEVADSSLDRDREEKLPIHARAGLPQYVILNLRNRTAEVSAEPDRAAGSYRSTDIVTFNGTITLATGAGSSNALQPSDILSRGGV